MLIFERNYLHGSNMDFSLMILSGKSYMILFYVIPHFKQVWQYEISADYEDGKSSLQKSLEILLKESYNTYIDNVHNTHAGCICYEL